MNRDIFDKDIKEIFGENLNLRKAVLVVFAILTIFIFSYSVLYPKFKSVANTREAIENEKKKLGIYQEEVSSIPILEERLRDATIEVNKKSEKLDYNMEDGLFIVGLDKKMEEQNISLVNFEIGNSESYEKFYAIPITLKVRGDYRHIRELMYYLEEQKNITQVLDYSMNTYIEELNENKDESINNNVFTIQVPSKSTAYYTQNSAIYHLYKDCSSLSTSEPIIEGVVGELTKNPCLECLKKYNLDKNQLPGQVQEIQKPKAKGIIEAEFKFIIYTKENPTKILDIENPASWKKGKYNPFTSSKK